MVSSLKVPAILIVDLFLFVFAALGVYQTHYACQIPVRLTTHSGYLITAESFANVPRSSTLLEVGGWKIRERDELEFALDGVLPGNSVTVVWISPNGRRVVTPIATQPTYGSVYLAVQIFVILVFFGFGLFLRIKRPKDRAARTAHWLALAAGSIVAFTWGSEVVLTPSLDLTIRLLYLVGTLSTGALYVHFALVFPRERESKHILWIVYSIGALLLVWSGQTAVAAYSARSLELFRDHLVSLHALQIYFSVSAFFASFLFARSYRSTTDTTERRKIKWALAGSAFSVLAYVLLWLLPELMGANPLVPEEIILLTSILAPITITIAIARYRLFDIDAVLSRATTYTLLIVGLAAVYVGLAVLLGSVLDARMPLSLSAALAVLVALLFEPTKRRLQQWVDFRFFRVRYDFREAERRLREELQEAPDRTSIESALRAIITSLLHPRSIEFVPTDLPSIECDTRQVEIGIACTPIASGTEVAMRIPITSIDHPLSIELGPKRSGARYSQEDLDLISVAATQASLRLERLALREKLAEEHLTAEREKELNRLRALVLSSVTHDLKTPLTSIRMFAELLKTSVTDPNDTEYLRIIEGETKRLTALIDNVLDYSRIERGTMEYSMEPVSLQDILDRSLEPMKHLMNLQKIELKVEHGPSDAVISGDPIALERALTNLITNAVKYSADDKRISVALNAKDGEAQLSVQDHGIGIPPAELDRIFQAYYRTNAHAKHAPGIGLGLATVQHVVRAHSGSIDVKSTLGQGTTFILTFPLLHA